MVRGVVNLPNGTGRTLRVAVFARGAKADEAREAGADVVGAEDLVAQVQAGEINFDRCIATPDMMPLVGRLGKVLGPRGLMPNPKVGTVTMDVKAAVAASKGGAVEFRAEKAGIVQGSVGKASFGDDKLAENIRAFVDAVNRAKPPGPRATTFCAPPSPRRWGQASSSISRRSRRRARPSSLRGPDGQGKATPGQARAAGPVAASDQTIGPTGLMPIAASFPAPLSPSPSRRLGAARSARGSCGCSACHRGGPRETSGPW